MSDNNLTERPCMKFIKGATSAKVSGVDDGDLLGLSQSRNNFFQVDVLNPTDTNLVFVAGVAEHKSTQMFEMRFQWHQIVLVLDGVMTIQDMDTGDIYRASSNDLFYWPPGANMKMGGEFRAYFVRTPSMWRWLKTPEGKKSRLSLLKIDNEILYPASPPLEVRQELIEEGKKLPRYKYKLIKYVKNALNATTVEVDNLTEMPQDRWKQVDLINPSDTGTAIVCGIAEHPTKTINPVVSYFWYHQTALIIDGEMIIEDLETGGVYKGQKGDMFYWPPGHRHHIGGKFKAFYVKTPVPLRWTVSPEGKRVFDMLNLANETSYPSSPPNERNMPPITNSD